MRNNGLVVQEGRGLYRLANEEVWSDPDLAVVSLLIPKGVICLLSALYFHQITRQIPPEVYVALLKDSDFAIASGWRWHWKPCGRDSAQKATLNEIQRFARGDRVERIMQPYLEVLA